MKNDGTELFTELRTLVNNVALAWTITLTDGTVFGFSSSDIQFTYLGVTFTPANGLEAMAVISQTNISVDNASTGGMLSMDITADDLLSGRFDDAEVRMFWIDPTDPTHGRMALRGGRIGEIKVTDSGYEAELRSPAQKLQQQFGDIYTLDCRANLGDTECKFKLHPPEWSASWAVTAAVDGDAGKGSRFGPAIPNGIEYLCVQAGTTGTVPPSMLTTIDTIINDGSAKWKVVKGSTNRGTVTHAYNRIQFTAAAMTEDAFFYNGGKLTWLTGKNAGISMEVSSFQGTPRTFHLLEMMNDPVEVGDTFEVTRGCLKTVAACRDTFNNIFNMRGFPFMPTEDKALETPNFTSQGEQKDEDDGGIS